MIIVLIGKDLLLEAKQRTNRFQVYIYIYTHTLGSSHRTQSSPPGWHLHFQSRSKHRLVCHDCISGVPGCLVGSEDQWFVNGLFHLGTYF